MLNIRPVSDLRNKYPEIEEAVLKSREPFILTKKQLWLHGGHESGAIFRPD